MYLPGRGKAFREKEKHACDVMSELILKNCSRCAGRKWNIVSHDVSEEGGSQVGVASVVKFENVVLFWFE